MEILQLYFQFSRTNQRINIILSELLREEKYFIRKNLNFYNSLCFSNYLFFFSLQRIFFLQFIDYYIESYLKIFFWVILKITLSFLKVCKVNFKPKHVQIYKIRLQPWPIFQACNTFSKNIRIPMICFEKENNTSRFQENIRKFKIFSFFLFISPSEHRLKFSHWMIIIHHFLHLF